MGAFEANRFTLGGVWRAVICLVLLVGMGILLPKPASASGTVTIILDPSTSTAALNQNFTVDIKINITDNEDVSAVQAYLTFDPTKLEVESITKDAAIGSWLEFKASGWANYWDNTTGEILYSVAAMPSPVMNETFVVATIEFKALAVTGSTPLTFVTEGAMKTKVSYAGQSILDGVQDGEVTIIGGTLLGHVDLQGRSTPEGWVTPLMVTFFESGTANVVAAFNVTTDNTGNFTVNDVPVGTFDIRVKCSHTLANLKVGVVISVETTGPINFGTLLEGDATDDNVVDIDDGTLVASCFGTSSGESGFIDNCDFNRDGVVDIDDSTLMVMNFALAGDIIV